MSPLLVWSQDDLLAYRSGYHVLADYLDAPRLVTNRKDPPGGWPLLQTRLNRKLSFSRWCTGGSFELEKKLGLRNENHEVNAVHYLWCDRDLGFWDLLQRWQRLPLIGTFHQCPDDLPLVIRRPSSLKTFSAIILMSENQRSYFLQHGVEAKNLHVIHHGVDTDHFCPSHLEVQPQFHVLSVGGTRRDFSQMATVAKALMDEKNVHFTIVGPEDKTAPFAGLSNVSYRIGISDAELLSLYRSAACFLHLPENATANNAMLEALACGAPIISQQIGGVPEYLNSSCALLADAGDTEATIRHIRNLAGSQQQQANLRQGARAHALTLDWKLVAQQTKALYRQCLAA